MIKSTTANLLANKAFAKGESTQILSKITFFFFDSTITKVIDVDLERTQFLRSIFHSRLTFFIYLDNVAIARSSGVIELHKHAFNKKDDCYVDKNTKMK